MGDDEIFILILFCIAGFVATVAWYLPICSVQMFGRGRGTRIAMALTPVICGLATNLFIRCSAAREVRQSEGLIALFTAGEMVALGVIARAARFLGVSLRDDAIEHRNPAAAIAICGAAVSSTIAYCGANVGEGATIYTTLGPAILVLGAMILLWWIYQMISRCADAISIDRDLAAGVRLAGLLVAIGLILGRAVAGDWKSIDDTLHDFELVAWPAIVLTVVAALVQLRRGRSLRGAIFLSLAYIAVAISWILIRGRT